MATSAAAFAQLAAQFEADGLNQENAERVAEEIARTFQVKDDEVAVLMISRGSLNFVYPDKLTHVGSIPLNTSGSVAARTASTKRAELLNNFAQTRHATVFEAVELGVGKQKVLGQKEDRSQQRIIQKLMSAPVIGPDGVLGVLQVCRKGISGPDSGADFTPQDLQKLVGIGTALVKCFK